MPRKGPHADNTGCELFHKPGKIRIPHLNKMVSIEDPSPLSPISPNSFMQDSNSSPSKQKQHATKDEGEKDREATTEKRESQVKINTPNSLGECRKGENQKRGNEKRSVTDENDKPCPLKKKVKK